MDPAALASALEAIEQRAAGSDAERRAAALCARQLRAAGRSPRTQTLWFRPGRDASRALYAALGVAASVVAVDSPAVGLGLAAGALAAALLEAAGVPLASALFVRRATQNVVAEPVDRPPGAVLLLLCAGVDAAPDTVLARLAGRARGWLLPGPLVLLALGLLGVAAGAAARLAGAGGTALGAAQLAPTALLIALLAAFVDAAAARVPTRAGAGGAAVAVAVAAALDARPPRRLAVEVLIAGAAHAGAPGMAAYVRAARRRLAPERVAVVELGDAPRLRHRVRDGDGVALALHPRLVELAAGLPGCAPAEGRARSAARVARGAGWPAIALEGPPRELAAALLRLVAALDADLARGQTQAPARDRLPA